MRRSTLVLFLLSLIISPSKAAGPFGSIHVGEWSGGAYTNDQTGSFTHCAAGTTYASGVYLMVGKNAQNNWLLGFASSSFHLTPPETFEINITFDGQSQFKLFGTATTANLVSAILPSGAAITQLRKSHLMVAVAKGTTLQFNLNSTGQLLPVIENCVSKTKTAGVAGVGDFSIALPKPTVAKSPTTGSPSSSPSTQSQERKITEINGTGFVIATGGQIITNHHVIGSCSGEVSGNMAGEAAMTLRVVSSDETNDLALLQAPRKFTDIATIKSSAVHSGDSVVAIGYPYHGLLTSDFTVTTGIVSSLSGLLNDTRYLQISAAVQPGNSGGPLLDISGNVVGVVAAKINALKFAKATGDLPENINFAIKTGGLRDFLDNSVVDYRTAESKTELKTAEIASKARAYTLLISCKSFKEK